MIERHDIFGASFLGHYGIGWIHLHDLCTVTAHLFRNLWSIQYYRSGELIQSYFLNEDFIVGKVVGLKHIDFLLDLLGDDHNLLFGCPAGNGIFVHSLNAGGRHIQTLNVYLPTGKYGSNLIQYTGKVLGENDQGVKLLILFHVSISLFNL